jgi:tRNA A37 threonylcarbamoyladenosine dehydratase
MKTSMQHTTMVQKNMKTSESLVAGVSQIARLCKRQAMFRIARQSLCGFGLIGVGVFVAGRSTNGKMFAA